MDSKRTTDLRGLLPSRLPRFAELLNRFISAEIYRAVAKPDRQSDGEAKPRLLRMSQIITSSCPARGWHHVFEQS
jgi:hypothetical protein